MTMGDDSLDLLMMLGLNKEDSEEAIEGQLKSIAEQLGSFVMGIELDQDQIKKIRTVIAGLGGDFEKLKEAMGASSRLKIDNEALSVTKKEMLELQKATQRVFGEDARAAFTSYQRNIDGTLNSAIVTMKNTEGQVEKFKAVMTDGTWSIDKDIKVSSTLDKDLKESLKAYKEYKTQITAIDKKAAQGKATEAMLEERDRLEGKSLVALQTGYARLNLEKEKGLVTDQEYIANLEEMNKVFFKLEERGQGEIFGSEQKAKIDKAQASLSQYKKDYVELVAIQKEQIAGRGTEFSEQRADTLRKRIAENEKLLTTTDEIAEKFKNLQGEMENKELKILDEAQVKEAQSAMREFEKLYNGLAQAEARKLKAERSGNSVTITETAKAYEIARRAIEGHSDEIQNNIKDEELLTAVIKRKAELEENYAKESRDRMEIQSAVAEKLEEQFEKTYGKAMGGVEGKTSNMNVTSIKDSETLQNYLKSLGYANAEVRKFNESQAENGRITAQAEFVLDSKTDKVKKYKAAIDSTDGSLRVMENGVSVNVNRLTSFQNQVESATKKIAAFSIAGVLLYGTMRKLKEGVEFISELDKSLTQVAIVQGKTREQVAYLAQEYADLGLEMGKTVSEIAHVNTELIRQGLTLKESEVRMRTILQLSSVGAITADESLKIITASVNALRVGHERAADVIVRSSQISASSVEEIGEAFTKTASSAYATGMQLEQTAAILSTLLETTQEGPSQLGTSLKTILARFSKVNEETGEFNEELNEVQTAIESVGVAFTDTDGQIRNVYDILRDLSGVWGTLGKNQQAYIATQAAGKQNLMPAWNGNISQKNLSISVETLVA